MNMEADRAPDKQDDCKPTTKNRVKVRCMDGDIVSVESNRHLPATILRDMYSRKLFCDVTIFGTPPLGTDSNALTGIRAHKGVLANASPHLLELFTSDCYTDSNKSEYIFENVTHESLKNLVEFIYADKLELRGAEQLCELLKTAKYLIMTDVVEACESCMLESKNLHLGSFMTMWLFARKYSCFRLMQASAFCIANNLAEVRQQNGFLQLTPDELGKLLLSESVIDADADQRCLATLAWLNHDAINRTVHTSNILNMVPTDMILKNVVFELCSNDVLRAEVPDLIHKVLMNAVKKIQPEMPMGVLEKLAGYPRGTWFVIGGFENRTNFLMFDVSRRAWQTLPSLPWKRRLGIAACSLKDRLVVMGGSSKAGSAAIEEYMFSTSSWATSAAKLSQPRRCITSCSDGSSAYSFGGILDGNRDGDKICTSIVERFDGAKVTRLSGMNTARCRSAVTFAKTFGAVFIAGGWGNSACMNLVQKYDINANAWSKVGQIITPRYGLATCLVGDDLYVAGGFKDHEPFDIPTSTVEILNISTGATRSGRKLMTARAGCSAVAIDENVFCVVGGCDIYENDLASVEVMDKREGKWTTGIIVPDMPESCSFFGFACI